MDVGTWCVGDEVSEKLGEVEPDVLQRGQVAVTLPLQVDPSPVYVLHKRLGQAVVTGVQHCCLTGRTQLAISEDGNCSTTSNIYNM